MALLISNPVQKSNDSQGAVFMVRAQDATFGSTGTLALRMNSHPRPSLGQRNPECFASQNGQHNSEYAS
jgi:hypothetical protein